MLLDNFVDKQAFDTLWEAFCLECAREAIDESYSWDSLVEESATMEGTNIEAIKIFFSKEKDVAKSKISSANRKYSDKEYAQAKKLYEEGLKSIKSLKDKLVRLDNNAGSTALSWLSELIFPLFSLIGTFDSAIVTRKPTSVKNELDAIDETMSWNQIKAAFVANFNKLIKWCEVRIKQCEAKAKG